MLGWAQAVALLVAAQRLGELVYARRNETRLRARGAVESGASHYPLFILLHGTWLLAVFLLIPADRVAVLAAAGPCSCCCRRRGSGWWRRWGRTGPHGC